MKDEYACLRDEILQWQEYRFLTLGASTALIAGVLAFELKDVGEHWMGISALLLFFLTIAAMLSSYAGEGNMKVAAYLLVFYEEESTTSGEGRGWESRLLRAATMPAFPKPKFLLRLNQWLALIYFVLGVASVALPWNAARRLPEASPALIEKGVLFVSAVLLLAGLYFLAMPTSKQDYVAAWRKLKEEEQRRQ